MNKSAVWCLNKETLSNFPAADYSKFKYGDTVVAQKFAIPLAEMIAKDIIRRYVLSEDNTFAIFGAPYNNLGTACNTLTDYVVQYVKELLALYKDKIKVERFKIAREHSYSQDYSAMSKEDRDASLSAETYEFIPPVEYINSTCHHLYFLDDIRITGSHEERIKRVIESKSIKIEHTFLYYASLEDESIDPSIEHELNSHVFAEDEESFYSLVHSLIKDRRFNPNTRVIKKLLSGDSKLFQDMLAKITDVDRVILRNASRANSYDKHPNYCNNFKLI